MDLCLAGKTVIIIGGSSNIGRATSLAFSEEGSNVVIVSRTLEDCQKVAMLANSLGRGRAIGLNADATKFRDVEVLAKKTLDQFGRIDVLVNSIGRTALGSFLELDPKHWDLIIATNYTYTLITFKVVLPIMIKQKSGNIVTISSVIGRKGDPHEAVYGGLKAGQINFTHSIAREVARFGIRVNVVAPGLTVPTGPETLGGDSAWKGRFTAEDQKQLVKEAKKVIPMGKVANPRDVAYAVMFLASDVTAGHITGNVIGVDGGLYMPH